MSDQTQFNWKERGSYVLLLLILIILIAITFYLSDLRIKHIEQDIPKVGELISPALVSPHPVFNHRRPS